MECQESPMGAVVSLLVIAGISLIIVRVGATALMMTGLSWDIASFQAYSAFFGVGFTTREAEYAVSTPHRRRIIKQLILVGNLGITAGRGSVIVAFVKADGIREEMGVLLWIVGGLVCLAIIAISPPAKRALDWAVRGTLKRAGVIHAADYSLLLRLNAGFIVSEVEIGPGATLAGRTLAQSELGSHGVVVLGISRRGAAGGEVYLGTPQGSTAMQAGDVLTVYGTPERIAELIR